MTKQRISFKDHMDTVKLITYLRKANPVRRSVTGDIVGWAIPVVAWKLFGWKIGVFILVANFVTGLFTAMNAFSAEVADIEGLVASDKVVH